MKEEAHSSNRLRYTVTWILMSLLQLVAWSFSDT